MIFPYHNESGTPTWKFIFNGRKTITRYFRPLDVGSEHPVRPELHAKAICANCNKGWNQHQTKENECSNYKPLKIRVKACETHNSWVLRYCKENQCASMDLSRFDDDAKHEGFDSWAGLDKVLTKIYGKDWRDKVYRIEFEVST